MSSGEISLSTLLKDTGAKLLRENMSIAPLTRVGMVIEKNWSHWRAIRKKRG